MAQWKVAIILILIVTIDSCRPCFALPLIENPKLVETEGPAFELVGSDGTTLRGGIEHGVGQRELDGCLEPSHLFVGTMYVRDPDYELLSLWGEDEGQLIGMIHEAIHDTLSAETVAFLRANRNALSLPDTISVEMWRLVKWVEKRKEQWRVVQNGTLQTPRAALRFFNLAAPVTLDSLHSDGGSTTLCLQDAKDLNLWVTSAGGSCDWLYRWSIDHAWNESQFGCSFTLSIITILDLVLRDASRVGEQVDLDAMNELGHYVEECRHRTISLLLDSPGAMPLPVGSPCR